VWGHAVAVDENDVLSGGGSRPPRVSSDRVVLVDEPCWVHTVVPAARGVRAVVALAVPSPTTETGAPCDDASRRPTTMTDPIAELIDAATETLRASMHIPAVPEYPSDLYRRSGNLVDLLGKLAQVVGRLDDTLKHLPQTWELDSDDSSPAGTHVATASFTLRATGAALDDAFRHANEAHSALLHLKLR
jgi:hypothetical protein